jgi:tRNA(adenine34) deaminase
MREALEQAKLAKKLGDLPFGAVIVLGGQIVGKGKCEDGTTGDVTEHAEINALRQACKTLKTNDLRNCTIYSTNEPCPMCASAIFQAKISKIIIGLTRNDLPQLLRQRKILMRDLAIDSGYEINIETGVLKEEILEQFEDIKK